MRRKLSLRGAWRKHYAIPAEHGSWIWWIGPLLVGAAAAGKLVPELGLLFLTALDGFLLRQPATIAVKALSGRRPREDLGPALTWLGIYLAAGLVGLMALLLSGHPRLLLLAIPGLPVFAWHLWLIRRREERRQPGVEIIASGVLALAAPAAYWTAGGPDDWVAWLLWGLTWFQAAASIVFIHFRLEQRRWACPPPTWERLKLGVRPLAYAGFNLLACTILWAIGRLPGLALLAFALTLADTAEGVARPRIGARPSAIGVRQLIVSALFMLLLGLGYLI